VQSTAEGIVVVPGGPPGAPSLDFLQLPVGFCAHFYARVGNPRQLRFAPGGDLFVASPTRFTTGGGRGGLASIVILPDDDGDGTADTNIVYLSSLPATQGMLFANSSLYFQDATKIRRVPFAPGDRAPTAAGEVVADITINVAPLHWPKPLDMADDGTIYVGNGGEESDRCDEAHSFRGGVLKLDGTVGGQPVAKGFRNPIAVRCRRGLNRCYAIELAKDFTSASGGREKIVPIRQGDDWGFPCCATKDLAYPAVPFPECSTVTEDLVQFFIGDTPFDLDFEMGKWPAPWNHRIFVPLHGAYGTWAGARVVTLEFDTTSGDLLPGSDLDGMMSTGAMRDFASGWADGTFAHGRPAHVAFAPDGRLFLSNDVTGVILWIAPLSLRVDAAE